MSSVRDCVAISKKIDSTLYNLVGEIERVESDFGWIRDKLFVEWVRNNGMYGYYRSNETMMGEFISDRLVSIFFDSETEQEANDKLNLLMFQLLEAGFDL